MAKWLAKTEPAECGIDDFARAPQTPIRWDGVRNYQARNFLKAMAEGDEVLVYHSSCKDIGIAGVVRVVRSAYTDPTQFDPESPYFDAKSAPDKPRWQAVDLVFERKLARLITLDRLKTLPGLENLPLVQRGSRLSVMPVGEDEWRIILAARQ
ncbi:EVE domain-containing protein [Pseudomonas sp. MAP12]|uniref:EVE domain-containing protein n=1 Tax=Geopseudomonas aromaticivorans TaxID=2849492 RepID=A0ABS6MVF4_9GAMM|nr:EVE domain-containing protein [Pseudomonas aromaticivorans]MBV2132772.1 EVE domain-containing protein [Pseudomonas aromaticivorans]